MTSMSIILTIILIGIAIYFTHKKLNFISEMFASKSNYYITLDNAHSLICKSKKNRLYKQHNHFKWIPHTHIGKSRGYINWKTIYWR